MATTLNKVTVGNDFVLKIKVGLVQYGNNTVSWDYMDLTTCRNIVFNISCTKHNIDINLPFTIDSEDHSVISAIVRAELLHANSIYNFTISGLDSNGYRWTYISPKQQSFLTTAVTEETSASAYTELAFTAGMIMPLAAQGKDGYTPYIGANNNWWINGVDTGISAIANIVVLDNYSTTAEIETMLDSYYTKAETDDLLDNIDLTDYATKTYVDNAVESIDIDTSDLVEKSDMINGYFVDGSWIGLDTGVQLSDTLKFELDIQRYGTPIYYIEGGELISANVNSNYYMRFGSQMAEALRVQYENLYDKWLDNTGGSDFTKHHIVFNLHDGVYLDGVLLSDTGSEGSVIARVQENGDTIPNIILHLANSNKLSMYSLKIYDGNTLLRDYTPVNTDNGNGYYDAVNDTYLLSQNLEYKGNYKYTSAIDFYSFTGTVDNKISNNVWGQINEIIRDSDCTEAIDKILNNDTLNNGWDIHHLWEIAQNAGTHQHYGGIYHDCKIDCKVDKNDEVPYEKTYYRFWHPTEKKYYNINVEWTYGNALDGPVISATYTVDDYATKTYVDNAIANIPGGSTPDLSNYVTNSSLQTTLADYVTDTDLSTELSDYVTNSSLSTELNDYVTNSSLSTELSDYVTSSDLQNNILSDYVTGTSLSTTLADYATQNYVDSAIANIPGGSTPDLSNYVTVTDLDNSINNDVYPAINESPLYDSEYHWIPQGYNRFIGGSDTIKIYDRYLCDAAGQSMRSTNNSFKLGIIKTQTIDPYTAHTSITYDNEVSINIWYERLATRAITNNYEYFDTTFTLTTEDRDISFEVVNEGTDLSGHYVICKITGATFGAVTGYSDITVYNGELDTTDKTIVSYNVASLIYDVTKTRYTVLYNIQQNDFSTQNWTTDAILRGYGLIGNSGGATINTVTQSQYDQLVADGLVESDQLYIIL